MREEYRPDSLPEPSEVEILVLDRPTYNEDERPVFKILSYDFPIQLSKKVIGHEAKIIAQLWRDLPANDDHDRCHRPPFGLRFYDGETLLLEASLCWECSNIFMMIDGKKDAYIFNPEHETSQSLLKLLKELSNS
jgi:hypothetical protein